MNVFKTNVEGEVYFLEGRGIEFGGINILISELQNTPYPIMSDDDLKSSLGYV